MSAFKLSGGPLVQISSAWESLWNGEVSHHGNEIEILAESTWTPEHFVFRRHRLTQALGPLLV
jgi:hypothetical protein